MVKSKKLHGILESPWAFPKCCRRNIRLSVAVPQASLEGSTVALLGVQRSLTGGKPRAVEEKPVRGAGAPQGKQPDVHPNALAFVFSCPRAWNPRLQRFPTETCLGG